jgi:hypothetical protein
VEEDIFGSDFESTDEEAEKVGEAGENEVIYEERRIRKVRQSGFLYGVKRCLVRQPEAGSRKLPLLLMRNIGLHLILTFNFPLPNNPSRRRKPVNESHWVSW